MHCMMAKSKTITLLCIVSVRLKFMTTSAASCVNHPLLSHYLKEGVPAANWAALHPGGGFRMPQTCPLYNPVFPGWADKHTWSSAAAHTSESGCPVQGEGGGSESSQHQWTLSYTPNLQTIRTGEGELRIGCATPLYTRVLQECGHYTFALLSLCSLPIASSPGPIFW